MKQTDAITLFDYNYWANGQIRNAASQVSPGQLLAHASFPMGSLRGTLVHIVDAEYGWRTMMERTGKTERWEAEELLERDFPTLESIQARMHAEESAMRAYLAGLDDARMASVVRYVTDEGQRRERPLWHCLVHVVNHGTQHRSEAAAMLTDYGRSPGDLDFTMFLNQRA
jgi:uncharacterized damage-inducible protein DinB